MIIIVLVPYFVVVLDGKEAGDQIKYVGPDNKLRAVDSLADNDGGQTFGISQRKKKQDRSPVCWTTWVHLMAKDSREALEEVESDNRCR